MKKKCATAGTLAEGFSWKLKKVSGGTRCLRRSPLKSGLRTPRTAIPPFFAF